MRTSTFTQEVADAICAELAEGKSLREICRTEGMPAESVVRMWALDNTGGFAAQYTRARAIGYERLAEDIIAISDDGENDTYKDDDGNVRTNQDVIARSRLRVDTRKWMLAKMLPKVYGDKITHQGDEDNPVRVISKIERVIVRPANTNG
jgi:hypothetical protein